MALSPVLRHELRAQAAASAVVTSAVATPALALPIDPTTGALTRCTTARGVSTADATICLSTRGPRQPELHHCACPRLARATGATPSVVTANAIPHAPLDCCCLMLARGCSTLTSLTPSLGATTETTGCLAVTRQPTPVPRPIVPGHRWRRQSLQMGAQVGPNSPQSQDPAHAMKDQTQKPDP